MRESNTQIEMGIRQGFCGETTGQLQAVETLLDCAGAAAVLGGLHPKTVERWAREGRIPAYHFFWHWKFRASELEVWMLSHVNSLCHPCRLKQGGSEGT
jgi:excisionase family DNA binding protein